MGEIVNPYIAGAPVTEQRMFFGREDIFQWIENSIAGQYADHILVIHGQRRVGKTSVLKQLGNRLPKRYIPVFFDLQGRTHTTLDRFLWWLAREIVRVLKQERGIEVPVPEKEDFTKDLEHFENRFLPDLEPALAGGTLLLTFDEFDNLEESEVKEELARPLVDYLRRLMGQKHLNFIFSIGSSGRKLENMQAAYTEFFKTALYKKISFLNEEQTRGLVTHPVEGVLEYERGAVDRVYQIASGHPYFTQLTCHELFARCQRTEQRRIAKVDVESVLDDVVERGTVNLKFVWDEATDIEKWSLAALAQMDKADNRALADYLRKNRVRFSESDLTSGLLHLREKDVVTPDNRFVIHLLRLWLQKNRPMEQAREELTEVNPIANRYIEIGLEFKDSHLYEKAIESFQEALAVAKDNIQAQVNIALTYMDQKAYSNAVVEFEKALTMDDEDVSARAGLCEAHLALGDAAMTRGRAKEAVQSYQRVLGINAEHTEARQRMAEISRQRAEKALTDGRDEEALSAFAEALKFTPEDEVLSKRFEEAKKERQEKVLSALLARAEKELAAKNWDSAISILQEGLQLSREDERFTSRIAAAKEKQRAAKLDSILTRASQAEQAGKWEAAVAALEEYLSIETGQAEVRERCERAHQKLREAGLRELRERARSLAKSERWDESLAAWNEFLGQEPADESARSERESVEKNRALAKSYTEAQMAFTKKNYDKAIALFKSIVMEDADYKDATRRMAEAVDLRRTARKWWQSKWVWGAVLGSVVLVVGWLGFRYGAPLLAALQAQPTTVPMTTYTPGISAPNVGSATVTVTLPPTVTPAPLPYTWARVNSGQTFSRDIISTIVFDPQDPGVIYVGTFNSGIYRSIDGGISWQPSHNGLRHAEIYSMAIDPEDPQTLYATGPITGLHISHDGGKTWNFIDITGDATLSSCVPTTISIDPNDHKHLLWSGGCTSMYHSKDGGESWSLISSHEGENTKCPRRANAMIHPADGDIYLALEWNRPICPGGLYISTDQGATWKLTDPVGTAFWQNQLAAMNTEAGSFIYAVATSADYENSGNSLYSSSDNGTNWTQPLQNCEKIAIGSNGNAYAICSRLLYHSTDGIIWGSTGALPTGINSQTIAVSPHDPNTILLGGSGLYLSKDGGSKWDERNSGLPAFRLGLNLNPNDPNTFYAYHSGFGGEWSGYSRLYESSDSGQNWKTLTDIGAGLTVNATGKILYRSYTDGRNSLVWQSTDGGQNWKEKALTFWDDVSGGDAVYFIAHPSIPNKVYAVVSADALPYIYISTDGGDTWNAASGIESVVPSQLFFAYAEDNVIYAVGGGMAKSENQGQTWSECKEFFFDTSWDGQILAIDPRNSDKLYFATLGSGILVSDDGCQSWRQNNTGLGSLFVNTIIIDPNHPDTLYAGTDGGAYISTNGGATWNQINDGLLGATVVYSIVVDKDSNVYAATPYGIFKLEGK